MKWKGFGGLALGSINRLPIFLVGEGWGTGIEVLLGNLKLEMVHSVAPLGYN